MNRTIDQFMWGFQQHFRFGFKLGIENALSNIGMPLEAHVVLVGFALDSSQRHQICVEPENGPISADHLDVVLDRASELFGDDPETKIIHSDRRLHEMRLENLFRRARSNSLVEAIKASSAFSELSFFASDSTPIGNYEVHTCVGIPTRALEMLPALADSVVDRVYVGRSLQHEVINQCLHLADQALHLPDPGSGLSALGETDSIVRTAVERLTNGAEYRATKWPSDLFSRVNAFASMGYERAQASGCLVVARQERVSDIRVQYRRPVPLHQARNMRKLLELSDDSNSVLVDENGAFGLGACDSGPEVVEIKVTGHAEWEMSVNGSKLIRVSYGRATLPMPLLDVGEVRDTAKRIVGPIDFRRIWNVVQESQESGSGTTLVVVRDPEAEVARLGAEGVPIAPKFMESGDVVRFGRVDGAILLGSDGRCHAFGVILDGVAAARGDPARGSRYNSAVRYQDSTCKKSIVIVISDDGTVDLIPRLRRRVHRSDTESAVGAFQACCNSDNVDGEEFARTRDRVKRLAFYLNDAQCKLVNQCWEKEMTRRFEEGGMRIIENPLRPHPDMDDSYFL